MFRFKSLVLTAVAAFALGGAAAQAQAPADFYRGKNVDLYIGYTTGGGYDVYARVLAQHMGKHIPGNPTLVPRNMDGAGSLRLANYLYNVAPKDGLAFGTIGRGIAFDPMLGSGGAQFEAEKFNWIGSANDEVSICAALTKSGITKFDQLFTQELIVGGTGATADTDLFPRVLNGVLGTKFKLITGYPGGNDVALAMQRGEVNGRCGWSWSSIKATQMNMVNDKTVTLLVQLSLNKHPDLPNLPLIMEYAKNDEQVQILKLIFARQVMGRPFVAPPGVPADRLAILRKAFMDTMKDPDFLKDTDRQQLEITAVSGEEVQKLVADVYKTPAAVAKKASSVLQ